MARTHRQGFVGTVRPVLWEGARGRSGLTDNYLRVRLENDEIIAAKNGVRDRSGDGLIEDVRIVRLEGLQLIGSVAGGSGSGVSVHSAILHLTYSANMM